MTKGELLQLLGPFTSELELTVMSPDGYPVPIKRLGYQINSSGNVDVTMLPMGSHLPDDWVDMVGDDE